MGDGEAYETFLWDAMPSMCRVQNFEVSFRGKYHRLERVLYKWFRCALSHEARLPGDVQVVPGDDPHSLRVSLDPTTGITLSVQWIDALANAVITAPENINEFGSPPSPPFPVTFRIHETDFTLGSTPPEPAVASNQPTVT